MEIILLLGAGLLGGAVNSLAGGGSFIVFPALLLAGVPPVAANATNTFAALPGYVSGTLGYGRDILDHRKRLVPYLLAALAGGYLGAELLMRVSDDQFSGIVPWLMGLAVILFAFGGGIRAFVARRSVTGRNGAFAAAAALLALLTLVCLYGGFFNAGLGIILLAFFALAGLSNLHAMNGLKLLISTVVAGVAIIRFGMAGTIAWYEGLLAFTGTLIGGYTAARLAHFIPMPALRAGIIVYGAALTLVFFWQAYA